MAGARQHQQWGTAQGKKENESPTGVDAKGW